MLPFKCKATNLLKTPCSFESGVFLWSINCFTELFTYEYNLINALLLGSLSAGTSYFLSTILDDFGLKFRNTVGGDQK